MGNFSHQEILPTRNSFPPGNPSHRAGSTFPPGNPSHREFLRTRKSFPPGNLSCWELLPARKSFLPGAPSRQKILPTRNSLPSGNPSHQEIFPAGNSFPPENLSCRELLPARKSFPPAPRIPFHQEFLPTRKFFIVYTRKSFPQGSEILRGEMLLTGKYFSANELILGNDYVAQGAYWIYLLSARNFSKNSEF